MILKNAAIFAQKVSGKNHLKNKIYKKKFYFVFKLLGFFIIIVN